jgi:methyl-accepting chemotaxis protein
MSEPLIRQQPPREPQSAPAERPSLVLFRNNKEPLPAKTESPPAIEKEAREHRTLRTRVDSAVASVRDSFEWKTPALGITGKLVGIFAVVAALFGIGTTFIVYSLASDVFETQINERADITAMNLSEALAAPVTERNLPGIRHELDSYAAQQDVAYAFVEDGKGNVLGATTTQLPTQTTSVLQPPSRFDRWTALVFRDRPVYETRAVIVDGNVGILHLGIWKSAVESEIRAIFWPMAMAVSLVVFLAILTFRLAIGRIGRLVLQLAQCANRISEGDLETASWMKRRDEIGKLAVSLERIRASLKAATKRLERAQPEHAESPATGERRGVSQQA